MNERARVLCHSHGGLIAYGWAFRHPTCVDRIAGMCPAIDFRTYPGLGNVITVPAPGLNYDLTLEELQRRATEFNPIDNLAPLAKAGVKIMQLHGDADLLVPTGANATELSGAATDSSAATPRSYCCRTWDPRKRGHDGPELYESATLLKFLLAD